MEIGSAVGNNEFMSTLSYPYIDYVRVRTILRCHVTADVKEFFFFVNLFSSIIHDCFFLATFCFQSMEKRKRHKNRIEFINKNENRNKLQSEVYISVHKVSFSKKKLCIFLQLFCLLFEIVFRIFSLSRSLSLSHKLKHTIILIDIII